MEVGLFSAGFGGVYHFLCYAYSFPTNFFFGFVSRIPGIERVTAKGPPSRRVPKVDEKLKLPFASNPILTQPTLSAK